MAWVLLIAAGLFEVVGIIGVKKITEKDNLINNILLIGGFLFSFKLLLSAVETIPLSTAYAVWTGIGTVGATIVGMIFFKESKSPLRLLCIVGVILSVVGLKLIE